jgi:probable rRNA maturation factor
MRRGRKACSPMENELHKQVTRFYYSINATVNLRPFLYYSDMNNRIFRFYHQASSIPFPEKRLNKTAAALIKGEKLSSKQHIEIILCSNQFIRRINRKFLKRNRATDVIAFEFNEPDILGEAYISLERAADQATRFGLSYEEEVVRLLVHAVIHILGYDHDTPRERAAMEKRESRYCLLGRNEPDMKRTRKTCVSSI